MIPLTTTLEADVAIVGGGIAGLMAAIAAADAGAKRIVLLEKANTRRSGSGATGNDHFTCYIPEVHGDDVEPVLQQLLGSIVGMNKDPALMRRHLLESFELVKLWEKWGIAMRPTGEWCFRGHALPGKPRAFLKFDGRQQKAVLTREVKQRGVTILNHHSAVEVCRANGVVSGLLALNTTRPEPEFTIVQAPAVVLATGLTHRLYTTAPSPAFMFNTGHCPNCAGGQGLGWRVGARMVNMELPYTHAGPKYFARCGKATWIGVYRYPDGRPMGPFATRSDKEFGDVTADIWNTGFSDVMLNGKGPVYIDCSDASPEDLAYMRQGMKDEGLTSLLGYMDDMHIDPARHAVEFMRYEPVLHGRGLDVDENGETTVPGLFAAGDMVGNAGCGIGLAVWLGWRCGKAAANRQAAGTMPLETNAAIQERMNWLSACMERPVGPDWKEANFALQQIMEDYAPAGPHKVRSETLLTAGLSYLENLRAQTVASVRATCSHTLMRTAEVLDLFDCAEAIFHAALARKETRGMHRRADFTFTNPLLDNLFLTVGKDEGRVNTTWRAKRLS